MAGHGGAPIAISIALTHGRKARMQRDSAPVIAAEMLLRRGFSDDRVRAHLLRQWPLDEEECQATLDAAHILLRREQGRIGESSDRARDS